MPQVATQYLGVDPGKGGGLAILAGSFHSTSLVCTTGMPATERDVWEWINNHKLYTTIAAIEWIHPAILGVGKSPMSKLYGSYMALRMALIGAGIRFEAVKPIVWQRAVGVSARKKTETPTQWKNRLKQRAQELFPTTTVTLATADALLIAEYCRRTNLQGRKGKPSELNCPNLLLLV